MKVRTLAYASVGFLILYTFLLSYKDDTEFDDMRRKVGILKANLDKEVEKYRRLELKFTEVEARSNECSMKINNGEKK